VRVLFASTRGAGHFNPLLPFAGAVRRRGHDVLVAGPPALAAAVEAAGYRFWQVADPPADELAEVWSRVPSLSPDEQNAVVIGEIFARLDATASLPRHLEACDEWAPDLVVREANEYGSYVAAEVRGIPQARVGIVLSSLEEMGTEIAAGTLDELGRANGLAPDPDAERVRGSPYLTVFPESFEDPTALAQPQTLRFRDPAWDEPAAGLPSWWGDSEAPLLYVTFGSVAGGLPFAPHVYGAAMEAVADLPARVLLTVGNEADLEMFAGAPPHVRVERWVPQAQVLAHADAVVCHGGSGSTLGALAAGLPVVVVPLFADQPYNGARVAAVGAGLVAPPDARAIAEAVRHVLGDTAHREAAERIAAEMRARRPIDAAADLFEKLGSDAA
jgi:UDP:flavonoid glycosyltransferase YjiC (YdhE family)